MKGKLLVGVVSIISFIVLPILFCSVTFAFNFGDANPELASSILNTSPSLCYDRVRVVTSPSTWNYSNLLESAYISATDGQYIEAVGMIFIEDLIFSLNKTVTVIGGYACNYLTSPYDAVLNGSLTISAGTLIVDDIVISGCPANFSNCNGIGCNTNVASDLSNCGGCGLVCSVVNGTGYCSDGICGIGVCNSGYGNCDYFASNGCETNLTNSVNNCGNCGYVCNSTNGIASCVNSGCQISSCAKITWKIDYGEIV